VITWIGALLAVTISVEIFRLFPVRQHTSVITAQVLETVKIIRDDNVTDSIKQAKLLKLSADLFFVSIKIFLALIALLLPVVITSLLWKQGFDSNLIGFLTTPLGLAATCCWAIIYHLIRNRFFG